MRQVIITSRRGREVEFKKGRDESGHSIERDSTEKEANQLVGALAATAPKGIVRTGTSPQRLQRHRVYRGELSRAPESEYYACAMPMACPSPVAAWPVAWPAAAWPAATAGSASSACCAAATSASASASSASNSSASRLGSWGSAVFTNRRPSCSAQRWPSNATGAHLNDKRGGRGEVSRGVTK